MRKNLFITAVLFSLYSILFAEIIPNRIGAYRVEVGPPGNEYYSGPLLEKKDIKPPSDSMIQTVTTVAGKGAKVDKWELENKDLYAIDVETQEGEFEFEITSDNQIIELQYTNDATKQEEEPDELIIKGTRKEIDRKNIPAKALKTIASINKEKVENAWVCQTHVGKRFVVQAGSVIYYATPQGEIRAIGLIEDGALRENDPPDEGKVLTQEEILQDAKNRLLPFQDKFSFEKNIARIGSMPKNTDGSFRFVVVGDSRSQLGMWQAIVQHIGQLDPKPVFAINSGDIVVRGYVDQYLDYYIPPLLKTDLPYFVALGNHDDGDSGMAIEYQVLFGKNSLNYFFDYGRYRFIIVDNTTKVLAPQQTLAWIEQTLKSTPKDKKIITAMHQPPYDIAKWDYHAWEEKYSPLLTDLLQRFKVEHVFLGHIHAYSTATHKGVHYTISGGGGAGLHDRYGPMGNIHHYIICDVLPDGTLKQQVVRFYKD
jgi:Icc-related predicted phosphoesterase